MLQNVIYKYPLSQVGLPTVLQMPVGSKILTAQMQGVAITLWALHPYEANAKKRNLEDRKIVIIGTGHEIEFVIDEMRYISTVQLESFVWHVFEIIELGRFHEEDTRI